MANYTILLIDYEPRSIERFREPLIEAGYAVEIATDGLSGIEAFHRLNPDMVLVEAMIPKKHGFEVCQELKRTPHGRRTPVIITTGVYKGRKYRTQALHIYGCDEYIEKPITPKSLLEVVGKFFESGDPAATPTTAEPTSASPLGDIDRSSLREDSPSSKATSRPSSIAKDDAEGEIMARLNAILPADSAPPSSTEPEARAIVAASDRDPFAQMRAELDAELGALARQMPFDSDPEPSANPLPSDQVVASSVLEALPDPTAATPIMPPTETILTETADIQGAPASASDKRHRQNKKSDRRSKGNRTSVTESLPVPSAPELSLPPAPLPEVLVAEERPPQGTIVEAELAPTKRRHGLMISILAAMAGVAIVAVYFVMSGRGSDGADSQSPSVPSTPSSSSAAEVATTPAVAEPASADTAPTEPPAPVAVAPSEAPVQAFVPAPAPVTAKTAPDRSKGAASVPKATAAKKTTDRAHPPQPVSGVAKPAVTPPTEVAAENPPSAKSEAKPTAPPWAPTPPDADANVAGVEAVPDSAAGSSMTAIAAGSLIPIDLADTMPVRLSHPAPVYSDDARQQKLSGTVVMNVLVNDRGTVERVVLVTGLPAGNVNESAINAARSWTYRPATKNGVPVKVWMSERVVVKL